MNLLLYIIFNFIALPIFEQLEAFRIALFCIIKMGAYILCCKIVSGHLLINLDILVKRNRSIPTLFNKIKDPAFVVAL